MVLDAPNRQEVPEFLEFCRGSRRGWLIMPVFDISFLLKMQDNGDLSFNPTVLDTVSLALDSPSRPQPV